MSEKRGFEDDLESELRSHLEQLVRDFTAAGMTEGEARRRAKIEFGGVDQVKEECRDARRSRLLSDMIDDLRYVVRTVHKSPGFTLVALFTLALGIGVNTAIFSVVNTVLLTPLHAPQPDRVVVFMATGKQGSTPIASEIKFNSWRGQTTVFEEVSASYFRSLDLTGIEQPQRVNAIFATEEYFRLFGLSVARGRTFTKDEELPAGPNVVVLSDALWKRTFNGDPGIIGRTVSLGGISREVIGVMPANVQLEDGSSGLDGTIGGSPDVWLPFPIDPNSEQQNHYFQATARLKPGVTLAMANADLQVVTQEFRRRFPKSLMANREEIFSVQPMRDVLVKDVRQSLVVLAGAVIFVLLIACGNVANLLLARTTSRRREIAIRIAVGATPRRVFRQLLTESLFLSVTAGVFGLGFGIVGIRALLALEPVNIPRIGMDGSRVAMDWRVLSFTLLLSLSTGLIFGLLPGLQAGRTDVESSLKGSRGSALGGKSRIRSLLLIGETSLAVVLLVGALLLVRTLITLRDVNPGFDPSHVLTTQIKLDPKSAKAPSVDQMFQDVLRRMDGLPEVTTAALTALLPLEGSFNALPVTVASRPVSDQPHGNSRWMIVSAGYFDALKIPLIRGRFFTEADRRDTPGVVIVNQAMVRRFWPTDDPLGDRILIGQGLGPVFEEPAREIVGIVGDVHEDALDRDPGPAIFVPATQPRVSPPGILGGPGDPMSARTMWIVIRTRAESPLLNSTIEGELRKATRGLPVPALRPMQEITASSTARQEFNMLLMSIFGAVALLMAASGTYAVMAYVVQQRTNEIGIRMALGAGSRQVRKTVLLQGMSPALIGIAIGVAAAFGLTRFLATFLFGVQPLDLATFITAPTMLILVALLAVWLPARRASRIDPLRVLRYE